MDKPSPKSQEHQWNPGDAEGHSYDPLLSALVLLTRMQNKPFSAEALRAGLPLVDNRLTPNLFVRAAARAGLSAQIVKRPITKITELVLPAVLLLDNEQACILTELNVAENKAKIIEPETGKGEKELGLDELGRHYLGYAIFVRPEYHFDEQANEVEYDHSHHLFWGTLARSWRIYRDVLVASFLVNMFALATPLFIMNVYDRVVPNNAVETLGVLAIGVMVVYFCDLLVRGLRGYFSDVAGKKADVTLAAMIFEKVMGLRMADRQPSVGAFANHLGEFESVRNFITSATVLTFVDLPFALLFLLVIWYIGGPVVLVPLAGIPVVILYALSIQPSLRKAIEKTIRASAQKTATPIESLDGAETIKTLVLLLTQASIVYKNTSLYESLKHNEENLNKAQEISHMGSWQFNGHTQKITWSAETYRIYELEPFSIEIDNEWFFAHLHPDDIDYVNEAVQKAQNGERYYDVIHRIVTAKGKEKIVHQRAEAYVEGAVPMMSGTIQDMTEQKRSEDLILRLSQLVEQNPFSTLITNTTGVIEYANAKTVQESGYTKNELIDKNMSIFRSKVHTKDFYQKMWKTIKEEKGIWRGTFINTMKDGSLRDYESTIFPLFDSNNEIKNFVTIQEDVTQRNIKEKLYLMQSKQAQMGEMLSMIAHQWRQHLSIITALMN